MLKINKKNFNYKHKNLINIENNINNIVRKQGALNMSEKQFEIKRGIKIHLIKNDIFKTNLISVMLTVPIKRETVTLNALVPFLLKRGTMNLKEQGEIGKKLEEMYGASYDCGIDKIGDNQALKFYIETINDNYALKPENLMKQAIDLLLEIVFNPLMSDGKFKSEFLDVEKDNLRKIIEAKKDNKDFYAFNNCIENMYGEIGFGLYKYGYSEDIDSITIESISEYYKKLVNEGKIDIYISGNFEDEEIESIVLENENIKKLNDREENFIINNSSTESKEIVENIKEIKEKMNITQGKLVIGLDVLLNKKDMQYAGIVYNSILGDGASSFLFQNVREKAGLAYTAKSQFNRMKSNIFIRCGIEIKNYDKAIKIIKEQLENIKNGSFSDEDLKNAKMYIISGIKGIETEQDTEIVFYIGQEMSRIRNTIEEYIEKINNITREDIIEIAENVQINTIYFLTGEETDEESEESENLVLEDDE